MKKLHLAGFQRYLPSSKAPQRLEWLKTTGIKNSFYIEKSSSSFKVLATPPRDGLLFKPTMTGRDELNSCLDNSQTSHSPRFSLPALLFIQ
ncbi:MAG: hypothetical protein ACKVOT_09895 [Polaromonas sp.]